MVPSTPGTNATRTFEDAAPEGAAPLQPCLVVFLGGRARVVALPEGVDVTIGRSRSATVFVDDDRVSRQHARLVRRGAAVSVADLGSRNRTKVGLEAIDGERQLEPGQIVIVGPLAATMVMARSAQALGAALADERHVVADDAMVRLYENAARVAPLPLPVLITGETGSGKERVAEAIHAGSPRAGGPFVRFHLGAVPETLVEAELFGHERGAFTGAEKRRVGRFEAAAGGTLFLDEIGELPGGVQAKLLRAIESRRIARLGTNEELEIDVRIVAATNRDLEADSAAGRFRRDLYFRLAGFRIYVPPLRERRGEIALLATLFARTAPRAHEGAELAPETLVALVAHDWPGNVRELRHVVESAVAMAGPGRVMPEHLGPEVRSRGATSAPAQGREPAVAGLGEAVDKTEREAIVRALDAAGGNQTRAARALGISRRALLYKMKRLDIRSVRRVQDGSEG